MLFLSQMEYRHPGARGALAARRQHRSEGAARSARSHVTPMGATDHILLNLDPRTPATWPATGAGGNTAVASSSSSDSSSSIGGDDEEYRCHSESAISAVHVQRPAGRLRGGGASVLPSALLEAAVQAQQQQVAQQQQQVQVQRQKSKQPADPTFRGGPTVKIPPFIIDPHTPWKAFWDIWVALLIAYSVIMVPLRVCFSLRSCIFSADWTWELFVDCCFFADILLTFRTALIFDDPEKQKRMVVTDARRIAYHYIKGWFVIDVVSTIPIDTIIELTLYASASAAEAQSLRSCSSLTDSNLRSTMMLRVLRLVRLLKLFRTLKLGLLFRRLDDAVNINPAVFMMARLLAYILLLSHLSACSWFGIFKQVVEEGSEPVANNWIEAYASAQLVPKLADAIRGDMLTQYTSALYWAFTTLCTVGYGDILPKNVSEMWFVISMEFVGLIVFSIAIAQLTNIMDNFNAKKKLLSARMAEVTRYMRERKMTPRMQRRVLRFYEYYLERVSVFDVNLMLSEVSQSLKNDICEVRSARARARALISSDDLSDGT